MEVCFSCNMLILVSKFTPHRTCLVLVSLLDTCAPRSRLSLTFGSCGWQTAGHSSCRAQGPRSQEGLLPWLAGSHGTASPSTCGLHHCPEIHLQKNSKLIYFAASALEVFSNWVLYKLIYSFIFIHTTYNKSIYKSDLPSVAC